MLYTMWFHVLLILAYLSYPMLCCPDNEFTCPDGTCINHSQICDTTFDCSDNSDELNCVAIIPCPEGLKRCKKGDCVDESECKDISSNMLPISADILSVSTFTQTFGTTEEYIIYLSTTDLISEQPSSSYLLDENTISQNVLSSKIISSMFLESNYLSTILTTLGLGVENTSLQILTSGKTNSSNPSTRDAFSSLVLSQQLPATSSKVEVSEIKTLLLFTSPVISIQESTFLVSRTADLQLSSIMLTKPSEYITVKNTFVLLSPSSSERIDQASSYSHSSRETITQTHSVSSSQNNSYEAVVSKKKEFEQMTSTQFSTLDSSFESSHSPSFSFDTTHLQSSSFHIKHSTDPVTTVSVSSEIIDIKPSTVESQKMSKTSRLPTQSSVLFPYVTYSTTTKLLGNTASLFSSVSTETKLTTDVVTTTSILGIIPKEKNDNVLYASIGVLMIIFTIIFIAIMVHYGLLRKANKKRIKCGSMMSLDDLS